MQFIEFCLDYGLFQLAWFGLARNREQTSEQLIMNWDWVQNGLWYVLLWNEEISCVYSCSWVHALHRLPEDHLNALAMVVSHGSSVKHLLKRIYFLTSSTGYTVCLNVDVKRHCSYSLAYADLQDHSCSLHLSKCINCNFLNTTCVAQCCFFFFSTFLLLKWTEATRVESIISPICIAVIKCW